MPDILTLIDGIDTCLELIDVLQHTSDKAKQVKNLLDQIAEEMTVKRGLYPGWDPYTDEDFMNDMDALLAEKGELESELDTLADTLGPTHADVLRDLCEYAAGNPSFGMSEDICNNIDLMEEYMAECQRWTAALNGDLWPYGAPPGGGEEHHWGLITPDEGGGRLFLPFGRETTSITIASLYGLTPPGSTLDMRNVRLLSALAPYITRPNPYCNSEMSPVTGTLTCGGVTYTMVSAAEYSISDAFTHPVDSMAYRVETYEPDDLPQFEINYNLELSATGPGVGIACDNGTLVEYSTNDTRATTFMRILGKLVAEWGLNTLEYFMLPDHTVSGFKAKTLIKRRDLHFEPQGETGSDKGGNPPNIYAFGALVTLPNGIFGIGVRTKESKKEEYE